MRDEFHVDAADILDVFEQHADGGGTMDGAVGLQVDRGAVGEGVVVRLLPVADQEDVLGTFEGVLDQEFPGTGESGFGQQDTVGAESFEPGHSGEAVFLQFFDRSG